MAFYKLGIFIAYDAKVVFLTNNLHNKKAYFMIFKYVFMPKSYKMRKAS